MIEKLVSGQARRPTERPPDRLPRIRRRLAERGLDRRTQRPDIPRGDGRPIEQSPPTEAAPTGPGNGDRRITFETYTPVGTPTNGGPIPPDPSGADSPARVVLQTGNSYLMASADGGATFGEHDTTAFLPAAQGRPVD